MFTLKNNIKYLIVFFILACLSINYNFAYSAASVDAGGDNDKISSYKAGKKLVLRAKKLEKKDKIEKAKKLYLKAYDKFEAAYAKDKKNADILNYLGYTLRKTGNLEKAEIFYRLRRLISPQEMGSLFKVIFAQKKDGKFSLGF